MTSAGIRDLKNNLSWYIRRLKPGQVITVTDRGRVVADEVLNRAGRPFPLEPIRTLTRFIWRRWSSSASRRRW